jgi:hypothetical protein
MKHLIVDLDDDTGDTHIAMLVQAIAMLRHVKAVRHDESSGSVTSIDRLAAMTVKTPTIPCTLEEFTATMTADECPSGNEMQPPSWTVTFDPPVTPVIIPIGGGWYTFDVVDGLLKLTDPPKANITLSAEGAKKLEQVMDPDSPVGKPTRPAKAAKVSDPPKKKPFEFLGKP